MQKHLFLAADRSRGRAHCSKTAPWCNHYGIVRKCRTALGARMLDDSALRSVHKHKINLTELRAGPEIA